MRAAALFFLAVLSLAPAASARPVREATGLEWLQMSGAERQEEVVKSMAILAKSGVEPSQQPHEYYSAIQARLRRDPALYQSKISNILALVVYDDEPESREALDALRKK